MFLFPKAENTAILFKFPSIKNVKVAEEIYVEGVSSF